MAGDGCDRDPGPMNDSGIADHRIVELSRAECERLLSATTVGRIGFVVGGSPLVLPVVYRFVDGEVVFRTSTGMKLHAVAANQPAAFEIDHVDTVTHTGWSVLVTGHASEVVEWDRRKRCEALGIEPWTSQDLDRWVRIPTEHVSGRRIVTLPG
jgi:nitroimidazol reductase NimA-like FMN-containing flavoprotein (pyridoxamine 5'-phosphate oxidase superfamily)